MPSSSTNDRRNSRGHADRHSLARLNWARRILGRSPSSCPSGRKMAERVVAAGYTTARPIVDGTVKDPDGYTIKLYRTPAARAP